MSKRYAKIVTALAIVALLAPVPIVEARGGGGRGGGHMGGGLARPSGFYKPGHNYNYNRHDWEAYCASRYRSFNPATGQYRGRDGKWRLCN